MSAAERRRLRERLIAARMAMDETTHATASAAIAHALAALFPPERQTLVGGYWPIRREFDCLPYLQTVLGRGGAVALPVVMAADAPLAFWPWRPGARMTAGPLKIPEPAEGSAVRPSLLLIPLVGFDGGGHRLGYGGGYYDRTLAATEPERPVTVGLGFELGRIDSLAPEPHDMRLDYVITEAGVISLTARGS